MKNLPSQLLQVLLQLIGWSCEVQDLRVEYTSHNQELKSLKSAENGFSYQHMQASTAKIFLFVLDALLHAQYEFNKNGTPIQKKTFASWNIVDFQSVIKALLQLKWSVS